MSNQNVVTHISPAQLWIGNHTHLIKKTTQTLQALFCKDNGCKRCKTCELIDKQQHHSSIWLKPEKMYTRDDIKVIFDTISFKLEDDQKLFFIIQHADFLTAACANSLLKSVEEPPEGYHFIFLAERQSQILPTIQSRCMIHSFYEHGAYEHQKQIIDIFKSEKICTPAAFLKILDEEKPNEKETIEIIDILLKHWFKQFRSAIEHNDQKKYQLAHATVTKLKTALQSPPMPGSSKIFWRNLYLQFG